MASKALRETHLPNLKLAGRGKVRDIYDLGDHLLIVATDRISAFDVVMADPIPDKGLILTKISAYWFEKTSDIVPNHLVTTDIKALPEACIPYQEILRDRIMLVKRAIPLPVECIVRGYLSGSAWKDYQKTQEICGIPLPPGLVESSMLDEPIFTPSTKAQRGNHDQNIPFSQVVDLLGFKLAMMIRDLSLAIYQRGREIAEKKGIIIADTKMEFGLIDDELILIDELMTPDSSRFWPAKEYKPGRPQRSFDKQFLRDYLLGVDWDRTAPAPLLPGEIIEKTRERYVDAMQCLIEDKHSAIS